MSATAWTLSQEGDRWRLVVGHTGEVMEAPDPWVLIGKLATGVEWVTDDYGLGRATDAELAECLLPEVVENALILKALQAAALESLRSTAGEAPP